jgi:nucleoside-triphosphatase
LGARHARSSAHEGNALILTGVPGCGKTTIMKKVAAALTGRQIRGFVTGELRQHGRRVGFEISSFAGDNRLLAHIDIDSRHRVGRYGVDVEALDAIVDDALTLDDAADVYLVDEIGKMECFSTKFCTAMRKLLDSGRPLVATVGLRGGGFVAEVKARNDVDIWTVTNANRNEMPHEIVRWLQR